MDVNSLLACNWWENKIVKADKNQNQEYWEKKKNIWQEITDVQGTWIYVKVLKIDKNMLQYASVKSELDTGQLPTHP